MKPWAALGLACVLLSACAERVPVNDETTHVAASAGANACADIASGHLLVLIRGMAWAEQHNSTPLDPVNIVASLQGDLAGAPSDLANGISRLLVALTQWTPSSQSIATGDIDSAASAVVNACRSHGWTVPATTS